MTITTYRSEHMGRPCDTGNRIEITWHPDTGQIMIDEHVDGTSWVDRPGYIGVDGITAQESALLIDTYGDGGLTDQVAAGTAQGIPAPVTLHTLLAEAAEVEYWETHPDVV